MQVERLEKAMRDLADNHTSVCHRFETLVEFSTKEMHSVATTLYFLQANKEEKYLGNTTDRTPSIYGFLAEDCLKTILDKPMKVEEEDATRETPEEKKNGN